MVILLVIAMNQLNYPDFETRGHTNHVTWDPAGVTGIITPWNAPLMLATWRIGPALAAGDTVVAKPPEWAPLTASLLADITLEAGMPPGVFNVEEFNPDPFMELLNIHGLPWDEQHNITLPHEY